MIIGGLHYAICIRVSWFTNLCVHIILYFNSTIIINGQTLIVDFGVDCSLDSTMGELVRDGGIF
jgi:hypothetical protein